jgi:hypothetical protein
MATARFALDEATAADWLAAQVEQARQFYSGKASEPPGLGIGGYSPQDDHEGSKTADLVLAAQEAGFITGPGYVYYDHRVGGGDCHAWLVRIDGLQLSTFCEKLQCLGSDLGAAAALSVLRQAVSAANGLLDDLDRYTHGTVMAAIFHIERTAPCASSSALRTELDKALAPPSAGSSGSLAADARHP